MAFDIISRLPKPRDKMDLLNGMAVASMVNWAKNARINSSGILAHPKGHWSWIPVDVVAFGRKAEW